MDNLHLYGVNLHRQQPTPDQSYCVGQVWPEEESSSDRLVLCQCLVAYSYSYWPGRTDRRMDGWSVYIQSRVKVAVKRIE